jgi:hypothetical protein
MKRYKLFQAMEMNHLPISERDLFQRESEREREREREIMHLDYLFFFYQRLALQMWAWRGSQGGAIDGGTEDPGTLFWQSKVLCYFRRTIALKEMFVILSVIY